MGMYIDRMLYLQQQNYLTAQCNKILDIGPQNVYESPPHKLCEFVEKQGSTLDSDTLEREITRLVYFSTPRPGERTTLLSEIADLTGIEYNSFDVCPGLKTDIVDLNFVIVMSLSHVRTSLSARSVRDVDCDSCLSFATYYLCLG